MDTVFRFLVVLSVSVFGAADAAIESVVVYPGQATVSREWQVSAQPGSGQWLVEDLPMAMREGSVRLEVLRGDGVILGGVEQYVRRLTDENHPRAQQLRQEIARQEATIQAIKDRLEVFALQQRFLDAQVGLEEAVAPGEWESALERLAASANTVFEQRRDAQTDLSEAEQALSRLQKSLSDLGNQQSDLRGLRIGYRSDASTDVRLRMSHTVNQASWSPRYEWRLDTEQETLRIEQFAEVSQSTGEDWANVALEVSLARPSAAGRLPNLSPWWLTPYEPQPQRRREAPMAASMAADTEGLERIQVSGSRIQSADLVGNDYTQRYRVSGRLSVSGDNTSKRFPLAQHRLNAELTARALPRRANAAWLYLDATFDGDVVLPPGHASLFQDGSLVGETRVAMVRPGEQIQQSFGVDDRIEVDTSLMEDSRAEEGTFRTRVVLTRRYQITLSNRHTRAVQLTILDVTPTSRDERLEVSLTERTPAPDRREVDDVPGALAWELTLQPGETRSLPVGYRVSYPPDIEGIQGW